MKKGMQRFDLFYNKDNFKAKRDKNMDWYIERQTCKSEAKGKSKQCTLAVQYRRF